MDGETYTITFGDQAENHAGMQKIGTPTDEGFELADLQRAMGWFESRGVECELIDLRAFLPVGLNPGREDESLASFILIARGGLGAALAAGGEGQEELARAFFREQAVLQKDTKGFMRGRVVNKIARHNLCFGEESQEPDYEQKRGRIYSFASLPLLSRARAAWPEILGPKGENLVAEGNYYYNDKCGIGFHGDSERRKVIGVRVGATMPLHYQWFFRGEPIGERCVLSLAHGDIYFMSEKATGRDWKRSVVPTLRHAAGAKKYLTIKPPQSSK